MYHRQLFASGETIREQKDEIAKLQGDLEVMRLQRDAARREQFALTDAEREAIAWAVSAAEDSQHPADDALRGLLKRTLPQS